ncbi:hypothetical protein COY27_03060 [Candidatus Woesearchaeota archaeon CG_4_10_14_0_2_um_filter_33_13]|nr:MAG: hypothetical protein COY27_03060 [Candidatus Woesearchaeota archaeon CG_4_10_14_0_2_um_filter_33_13]
MKKTEILATFIGSDSLGYVNGQSYLLEITQHTKYRNIAIQRKGGGGTCEYSSIITFFKNWNNIYSTNKNNDIQEKKSDYICYVTSVTDENGNEFSPEIYAGLKGNVFAAKEFFEFGESNKIEKKTLIKLYQLASKIKF